MKTESLAFAVSVLVSSLTGPVLCQPPENLRDVEALEAQLEEMFEAAVILPDDQPMQVFGTWSSVLMSAVVLEQNRAFAEGRDGATLAEREAATEGILARWEERRPDSAGPHLLRTVSILDSAAKRDAVVAIADRYPDDALALSQAAQMLQQTGDPAGAVARLQAFITRNPRRSIGYHLLVQHSRENATRQAEVLERWAEAIPGDPELVRGWLASPLATQEPEATRQVVSDFFDRPAADAATLGVCLQLSRHGDPTWEAPAWACVTRIASDPEQPEQVTERATKAIAERAAAAGDWSAFLATLEVLAPAGRIRALIETARSLRAPERCADIVELLTVAAEAVGREEHGEWSMISAARGCSDRSDAQALFLELIRRAPADEIATVIGGWTSNVNGEWQGKIPPETGRLLEERIAATDETDDADALFAALDIVYQLEGAWDRRSELLMRWQAVAGVRFDARRAVELAADLLEQDRRSEALAVLERQLARRFEQDTAFALWELYLETEGEERAARLAEEIIQAPEGWKKPTGHLLAARGAIHREDLAAAERHYWSALEGEHPPRDIALELLVVLGSSGEDGSRAKAAAARLCETALREFAEGSESCAADLLVRAGRHDLAADLLLVPAMELPDDLPGLRQLASTAHNAGRTEIVEAVLRRILELDPRSEASWTGLGGYLEKAGRAVEVAALLERSRELFDLPPSELARAAGRGLAAGGDPERAIDILLEARGRLPETSGGDWSRGWIDSELAEAYRAFGKKLAAARRPGEAATPELGLPQEAGPACTGGVTALERSAAEGDVAAAAYLGKVRLYGHGDCVAPDRERSLRWLESAVAADRPGADYDLGLALLLVENPGAIGRALRLLEQAAARPQYLASETLALLHASGVRVPRDVERSRHWMAEAARRGSDGFPGLRDAVHRSPPMRELVDLAVDRLDALASDGDAPAAALLARLYTVGLADEPADPGRPIALARSAAEAGEAGAMRVLMHAYGTGTGVEADETEKHRWRARCARAGDSFCRMFLGHDYLKGDDGVEQDVARGLDLLRRAAAAGNWWATAELGRLYDQGSDGVARDPEEAARWKRQLAELGDLEAQGWLHYHGAGPLGAP